MLLDQQHESYCERLQWINRLWEELYVLKRTKKKIFFSLKDSLDHGIAIYLFIFNLNSLYLSHLHYIYLQPIFFINDDVLFFAFSFLFYSIRKKLYEQYRWMIVTFISNTIELVLSTLFSTAFGDLFLQLFFSVYIITA